MSWNGHSSLAIEQTKRADDWSPSQASVLLARLLLQVQYRMPLNLDQAVSSRHGSASYLDRTPVAARTDLAASRKWETGICGGFWSLVQPPSYASHVTGRRLSPNGPMSYFVGVQHASCLWLWQIRSRGLFGPCWCAAGIIDCRSLQLLRDGNFARLNAMVGVLWCDDDKRSNQRLEQPV
jgi:hypothetical protein